MTESLQNTVIDGGYCIGCAACTAVEDSRYSVYMDERGRYQASASGLSGSSDAARRVCPFSDESLSEDTIWADLFGRNATFDDHIGYHIGCFAGYVKEGDFREPDSEDPTVYSFSTMDDPSEVLRGSRSVYYPVEMSEALSYIRERMARSEGRISLDDLAVDQVTRSQRGGFRHRREGLSYRLHMADRKGVRRRVRRVRKLVFESTK